MLGALLRVTGNLSRIGGVRHALDAAGLTSIRLLLCPCLLPHRPIQSIRYHPKRADVAQW